MYVSSNRIGSNRNHLGFMVTTVLFNILSYGYTGFIFKPILLVSVLVLQRLYYLLPLFFFMSSSMLDAAVIKNGIHIWHHVASSILPWKQEHQSVQLCKNGIFWYVRIWVKNYLTFYERIISFLQLTK